MEKGKIIVIEGACDGIGKTTQYELLYKYLKDNNQVFKHHFPTYNTFNGKGVEEYLSGKYGDIKDLPSYFISNLYAYDRSIMWYSTLKEKYENNNIILLDRYTTSTLIYQSALIEDIEEKKEFIDYVMDFEYNKLKIGKPDKVIFLTGDFSLVNEMRIKRKDNEGIENDIHENNLKFMKKVYDNALFVAEYLGWDIVNCSSDNKMRTINEIHEDVITLVKKM